MYRNPKYDLSGYIIVEMEYNGAWIEVPLNEGAFIPNGVSYAELKAAYDANEPQDVAAYSGPSADFLDARSIRHIRDSIIKETDVWGLADYPATAEQTAYRQALRDITSQAGFPTNVTWPTKPE